MMRIPLITAGLMMIGLSMAFPCVAAGQSEQSEKSEQLIQTVRTYLDNGNPDQAIYSAQRMLKKGGLNNNYRMGLLALIAQAEVMRVTHRRFNRVSPAIRAIETILNEFPDNPQAEEFRWQLAWLWWKSGDARAAITAARQIIAQDQQPANLRRAWLLMARIHIHLRNFSYARSDLLQYGLHVDSKSRQQAEGMAWMGMVDWGELRPQMALKSLHAVYQGWPKLLTAEAELFSTYIQLLYWQGKHADALNLAENFIGQYIHTEQAAPVRLIRADVWAKASNSRAQAIKEYAILAASQAETMIGRQAFMRKLMLEYSAENDRDKLVGVMVALRKIAARNQLSVIEDEAMLDMARLWTRITSLAKPDTAADTDTYVTPPALQAYARAATSLEKNIAQAALKEGAVWLHTSIQTALDRKLWLKAVGIWRQFPQLRPQSYQSHALRLGIAHAMRMLMLFDDSEVILQALYKANSTSIRGERSMLELAMLWMERQDSDGVKKIMAWLNRHEFSMYRPEMLLIAARIQLAQKHAEQARQTLSSVRAADIAIESRASYWQTRARLSERLSEWHRAAQAWAQYRNSTGADAAQGLNNQADNLFAAQAYAQAISLYQQMPKAARDAAWQYHMGICELRGGETKQGSERLQKLAASTDGSRFIALAKLALADQQAGILLGEKP